VFQFSSIPGALGHLLLGPSPALIIVSVSTPSLTVVRNEESVVCCAFFKESVALIHSERRRGDRIGAVEYSFCKMDSHCQRGLANPRRFVGWCAGGQWLPS
jgi:hypothetical protein